MLAGQDQALLPLGFPASVSDERWLRGRQRECGVDVAAIEDPDIHEQRLDEIDAVQSSWRGPRH